jgi:hypothetical protein
MTPQVDFHPAAMDEVVAARRWYFEVEPALADAFDTEMDRAIENVLRPRIAGQNTFTELAKFLLHRFP